MRTLGEADDFFDAVTAAQEAFGDPVIEGSECEQEIDGIWMELDKLSAKLMQENDEWGLRHAGRLPAGGGD